MKRSQHFAALMLGLTWPSLIAGCASKPAEQAATPPPVAPAVTPPAAPVASAAAAPTAPS